MKALDLIGKKFGRLLVKNKAYSKNGIYWNCLCDCGNKVVVCRGNLISRNTKSCGCLKQETAIKTMTTHGMFGSAIYSCWGHMLSRCQNKNDAAYKDYGGRGIKICSDWNKFENFYIDMGDIPKKMTLDRIDNDGDYCPENCRWATRKEQSRNRRDNRTVEYKGTTKLLVEWADEFKLSYDTLRKRINVYNWPIEKALTQPVRIRKHDNY